MAVDGSEILRSPVEVGSLSHYLQGFIHARWLFGISSINSNILCEVCVEVQRAVMHSIEESSQLKQGNGGTHSTILVCFSGSFIFSHSWGY